MKVIKKNGELEDFNDSKIVKAINKSANRINVILSDDDTQKVCDNVRSLIKEDIITVEDLHKLVEVSLELVNVDVSKSYKEYRNYKVESARMWNEMIEDEEVIRNTVDRSNANTISTFVPVQRSLILKAYQKKMYKTYFLSDKQRSEIEKGVYYIHDLGDRGMYTHNCCLFDMENVLKGGFELCGLQYSEPKSLSSAFQVFMDVLMSAAACQYGGFTVESIDTIFSYYAEKSYIKYKSEFKDIVKHTNMDEDEVELKSDEYAYEKVRRDYEQGFQGIEYKLATCVSSRGDFPFSNMTFGLEKSRLGKLCVESLLKVREEGQGNPKKPQMFPKYVFLFDKELHSEGKELNDIFELSLRCQSKTMYPDFLSLTGDGYVADMYKKYGTTISPMGKC